MANPERLSEKTKKALMRGYRDLLTIHKLIERYQGKEGANPEVFKKRILDEVHAENRDEMIFNKTLIKFEKVLEKTLKKNSINPNEVADVIKRIEDFRKYLVESLSEGGTLEQLAEKGDYAALRAEIEKDISIDQKLYQQIEALWKEMDEELENKKKEDAGQNQGTSDAWKPLSGDNVIVPRNSNIFDNQNEFLTFCSLVGSLKGEKLTSDECKRIWSEGFRSVFIRSPPPDINYEISYLSASSGFPQILRFTCTSFPEQHADYLNRNSVYAGTIASGRWSADSGSWLGEVRDRSWKWRLGRAVNNIFLKKKGIPNHKANVVKLS